MEITQERVLDAYKRKVADLTEQVVMMEALVATLQAAAETVEAQE